MPSPQPGPRCALCRTRPVDPAWRPFCGERCKTQDLANWADQSYRVPGTPLDDLSSRIESDLADGPSPWSPKP